MSIKVLEDYLELGNDINDFFIDNESIEVGGKIYNDPNELKRILNLSDRDLRCTSTDDKKEESNIKACLDSDSSLITCEDIRNTLSNTDNKQ